MERDITIVAPHPDDEIIGCYHVLKSGRVKYIVYADVPNFDGLDIATIDGVCEEYGCDWLGLSDLPLITTTPIFYFPDPYFETHPAHRALGAMGEAMLRASSSEKHKQQIIFYSVNMRAPYIFEVPHPKEKQAALDALYPEKKSLWEYDHRYFLFEGYCEWAFGGRL